MSDARPKVAIIGVGAMGGALLEGLRSAGWETDELSLVVRRPEHAQELADSSQCRTSLDPVDGIKGAEVIVFAVKPRDVRGVLQQLAGEIQPDQVIVSLAAGVATTLYEELLGAAAVVRAMPNTPALVREGITGVAPGLHVRQTGLENAEQVLNAVGQVVRVDESLLDAVTAVSGTGPAYAFLLAEALTEAALREGIPRYLAEQLVHYTLKGAGSLLIETGDTPSELRSQVTSPGGTTAAAMHILEERGFRALVEDAVRAAAARSRELGVRARGDDQG